VKITIEVVLKQFGTEGVAAAYYIFPPYNVRTESASPEESISAYRCASLWKAQT
jgi:hypothetical protein